MEQTIEWWWCLPALIITGLMYLAYRLGVEVGLDKARKAARKSGKTANLYTVFNNSSKEWRNG